MPGFLPSFRCNRTSTRGYVRLADKGEGGMAVERLAGKPKYHATKGFGMSCLISARLCVVVAVRRGKQGLVDRGGICPRASGPNSTVTDSMEAHQYMNRTYSHVSNCRAARRDGQLLEVEIQIVH
jgi:hypothetical protein